MRFRDIFAEWAGDGLNFVFSPDVTFLWLTGLKAPTSKQTMFFFLCNVASIIPCSTPEWELLRQKLKSYLVRTQSLNVLPLKPGVGQYIALHAMLTARDFFLAYFYPSSPFTCIFSRTFPDLFLCWLWLTHGSCVGPQNKIDHPAGCRFPLSARGI